MGLNERTKGEGSRRGVSVMSAEIRDQDRGHDPIPESTVGNRDPCPRSFQPSRPDFWEFQQWIACPGRVVPLQRSDRHPLSPRGERVRVRGVRTRGDSSPAADVQRELYATALPGVRSTQSASSSPDRSQERSSSRGDHICFIVSGWEVEALAFGRRLEEFVVVLCAGRSGYGWAKCVHGLTAVTLLRERPPGGRLALKTGLRWRSVSPRAGARETERGASLYRTASLVGSPRRPR